MKGVYLALDQSKVYLDLTLKPTEFDSEIDHLALYDTITSGQYAKLFLFDDTLRQACHKANELFKAEQNELVKERIAERRDGEFSFRTAEGEMSASLSITAPYGGKLPGLAKIVATARDFGIVKGLGLRHIKEMLTELKQVEPGTTIDKVVAKGLPPKDGKSSRLQPLVPNALERVLRPQSMGGDRVDMRNLGDVICVKAGTEVLRRLPPTPGRKGYTVTNAELSATPGNWIDFKPGEGTVVSDHDENLLIAEIAGMPKFKDGNMFIDDTFICKGVNVGTGNIKYDGAVLVNGDVTEKMVIIASGDVTINGFVESATIQAGGDIIITEGAMGKVSDDATDYSTKLVAQGSIHLQHGQGLDILSFGDVSVGKQLAYSKIASAGSLTVGPVEQPNGNLFSCAVQVQGAVSAGTLGAISGSQLSIDFSHGFNALLERQDSMDELLQQLKRNNIRHKDKLDLIRSKFIPQDLQDKVDDAAKLFRNEANLLQWMQQKVEEVRQAKEEYQADIKLVAQKRLYPGVTVKLNNRTWRAEKEYGSALVSYEGHKWEYQPLL